MPISPSFLHFSCFSSKITAFPSKSISKFLSLNVSPLPPISSMDIFEAHLGEQDFVGEFVGELPNRLQGLGI